jgi:putative phage-type endonuclease
MPLSDQQAEARKGALGASEVPALFNEHPHLTRWELWQRKAGALPEPDAESLPALWGNELEPAIARGIAKQEGWRIRKVHRAVAHPTIARFGASLDYEILATPTAVLEIKNVDRFVFSRWPDGKPPLAFELQVQAQLACARRGRGVLGVLVGGNTPLVLTYERHPGAIARIEREVVAFWQSIDAGQAPEPDFELDYEAVAVLYGQATPGSIKDFRGDHQLAALCADYRDAAAARKDGEQRAREAKAKILMHIRDTETAITDGFKVSASVVPAGFVEGYQRKEYRAFAVRSIGGGESDDRAE